MVHRHGKEKVKEITLNRLIVVILEIPMFDAMIVLLVRSFQYSSLLFSRFVITSLVYQIIRANECHWSTKEAMLHANNLLVSFIVLGQYYLLE
jgi:hypothetical protein